MFRLPRVLCPPHRSNVPSRHRRPALGGKRGRRRGPVYEALENRWLLANTPPVAFADTWSLSEDALGLATVPVLLNDTDADAGDSLSVVAVDGNGYPGGWELVCIYGVCAPLSYPGVPAIRGTVAISGDGQATTYTLGNAFQELRAGQTATEQYLYTVRDSQGGQSSNWVHVSIVGANDAPQAHHDSISLGQNAAPRSLPLLQNDTDVDLGDTLTLEQLDLTGTHGTVTLADDRRSVLYEVSELHRGLTAGQSATDTFRYTVVDRSGASSMANVTVLIEGGNQAPVAHNDSATAWENGQAITIDVLGNDTDLDGDGGDTWRVTAVDGTGLLGSVTIAPDGLLVRYAVGDRFQSLAAGVTTTETFHYTVRDRAGAEASASVTVTVTGTNDSPTAVSDAATATEDGGPIIIPVLANDADVDQGDTRRVIGVDTTGLVGTVTIAPDGSSVTYDVGDAFQSLKGGALANQTFRYTMADGQGASSTALVTLTIAGVNDSPVAVPNQLTLTEDAPSTTIAVLGNDIDIDGGDTRRVTAVHTAGISGYARVAVNGTGVIYSTNNAFQHLVDGQTVTETFSYTMADAAGAESNASISVVIRGVTDGPKAVADTMATTEDAGAIHINVLQNDFNDLDTNENLTVTSINGAGAYSSPILGFFDGAHQLIGLAPGFPRMLGQAAIAPDGRTIVYTPPQSLNEGESGVDTFLYTITGSSGASSTAAVTVTVTGGANDRPVAFDDHMTVRVEASPVVLAVLANDTDPDTRIDPPAPIIPPSPFSELIFDPTPLDVPDTKSVLSVEGNGMQGTVAVAPDGQGVIYTVGGDLLGLPYGAVAIEHFTYTMRDRAGAVATATGTITVLGANQPPVAQLDAATVSEDDGPVTIPVLANDIDPNLADGDQLTLISLDREQLAGLATIENQTVRYEAGPAFQHLGAGEEATDVLGYTMADREGKESTASIHVVVHGTNDAPQVIADSITVSEDAGSTVISVLDNDIDVDQNDAMTIVALQGVALQGSVSPLPDGTGIVYRVADAFQLLRTGQVATETFTYTVRDTWGAESTALVTLTIVGANEPIVYVHPPLPGPGALVGTAQDDTITATTKAEFIYGQAGDDELRGEQGDDTLFGGDGDDEVQGGMGNDVLNGGAGGDDLSGGPGSDLFRYYLAAESTPLRPDKIEDFNASEGDRIDLSLIDADTVLGGNNDFVVVPSLTRVPGQLVIDRQSSDVYWLRGDINGDGVADLQIEVRSRAPLTPHDLGILEAIPGDLNGDQSIDAGDAGVMFGNWGQAGAGDLNNDGIVDAADATILFANWSGDPLPSPSFGGSIHPVTSIARDRLPQATRPPRARLADTVFAELELDDQS